MKKSKGMVLLILTLVCLLLPAAALAAKIMIAGTELSPNTYYVNDGAGITTTGASASSYNVYLDNAGTTLNLKSLNVLEPPSRIGGYNYVIYGEQVGSMTLVLEGDNTIRTGAGGSSYKTAAIYINQGSLTIDGPGKLTATGTDTNLELSCGIFINGGNLTVKSGTVIAKGGAAAAKSYGVYANGATTVNGTLSGTADTVGSTGEPGVSYGVYSGGAVSVTGELTGTGGKAELGTSNPYAATSIGVQCGGEVNVSNGSLTGTGREAVANSNNAISIGVDAKFGLNVTGNNGSVVGTGGACSKTSGNAEASSYGVRCGSVVVVGSSSTAETSFLSGTGGTANDTSGSNISNSFGVYGTAPSGTFTVNEGATLTGIGGDAFASRGVSTNNDCNVEGTLNGTGKAFANGTSYGVIVSPSKRINLSGSMTARANGGDTGNASTSIGVSAGGGIHMTGQGYLLASTSVTVVNNNHSAKALRTSDG